MYICHNIKRNKGQIFIVAFWIIIVLGGIVLGLSYRATHESTMVSNTWERAKAYYTTRTGIREVMKMLNEDDVSVDTWWEDWAVGVKKGETKYGKWQVGVIYDTERYVNIAGYTRYPVPDSVIKRIFYYFDPILYYALLDWRDADNIPRVDPSTGQVVGAEDDFYQNFGYESRDGPLKNLFELGMLKKTVSLFDYSNDVLFSFNIDSFKKKKSELENIQKILSFLGIRNVYAHGGDHSVPALPPPPPPPNVWPPPMPGPIDQEPDPEDPDSRGFGRSVTVYGDGRVNINTAVPGALLAMGLSLEAARRIYSYNWRGHSFTESEADYIIQKLIDTKFLYPTELQIKENIKDVAHRFKVNSSYFFVYIISHTSKAAHAAMAVIKRYPVKTGNRCQIVSWWEWIL